MRVFVFLLVLANLVFLAWSQGYLGGDDNPDAVRLGQQLAADRLRVVSRDRPPAPAPASVATPEPVKEGCLAWTALSAADADAVDGALAGERFTALRRVRHAVPDGHSWWVFIPPLANKAEADRKAGELKRLGVPEYFVIQDAGPNRFAISLGIFSSEQAAEDRLAALRAKGVRSAKTGPRGSARGELLAVEASGPEALVEAAREAVAAALPAAKTGACGKG